MPDSLGLLNVLAAQEVVGQLHGLHLGQRRCLADFLAKRVCSRDDLS